jgi:hypothetical protein
VQASVVHGVHGTVDVDQGDREGAVLDATWLAGKELVAATDPDRRQVCCCCGDAHVAPVTSGIG